MDQAESNFVELPDFAAPPGGATGIVQTSDGLGLRYMRWAGRPQGLGTIVIATGRSEFIEKYFEVVGELLQRGFCVVVFDWRGQGLSQRQLRDRAKGHVKDFSAYLKDLAAIEAHVLKDCPQPWFALGHSMGGAILLDQAHRGCSPFARIVLSAPMIDLSCVRYRRLAHFLAGFFNRLGLGRIFVPGGQRSSVLERGFAGNPLSSDEARFNRMCRLIAAGPRLRLGDPTIAWAHAAFRLMRKFEHADYPRRIRTPVLILAAQNDGVVDSLASERFAARLKTGRQILIAQARHEILIERDDIRAQFWAAFDAFIPGAAGEEQALLARHTARDGAL
jgi:lysophospholipase